MRFEAPNTWILEAPKGSRSFVFLDRKPEADADIRLDVRAMPLAAARPDVGLVAVAAVGRAARR